MPDLITIDRSELRSVVIITAQQVLRELGIKTKDIKPWISQNQASKIIGRRRLATAMKNGKVKFKKPDYENPKGRVFILKKDLEKLINSTI
jgi:hypothetical protein